MPLTSRPSNYSLRSTPQPEQQQPEQLDRARCGRLVEEPSFIPSSTMAAPGTALKMDRFSGDGSQDIDRYLNTFDDYIRATSMKDEQAVATLALHLTGLARLWYEGLSTRPANTRELQDLLKAKFKSRQEVNLEVYNMKQSPGEPLSQFLNRVEQATYIYHIEPKVQVFIALKGMERSAGHAISGHAPKTLQDVRNIAAYMQSLDMEVPPSVHSATPVSTVQQHNNTDSADKIRYIETRMDEVVAAISRLETSQLTRNRRDRRPEDNLPRHVSQRQTDTECSRCGGRCYSTNSCRAMGKTCFKCNKLNHFGSKCRSSKMRQNENNNTGTRPGSWSQRQ